MSELNTRPTLESVFEALNNGFAAVKARLDEIDARLVAVEVVVSARLEGIAEAVDHLDAKIDILNKEILDIKRRARKDAA